MGTYLFLITLHLHHHFITGGAYASNFWGRKLVRYRVQWKVHSSAIVTNWLAIVTQLLPLFPSYCLWNEANPCTMCLPWTLGGPVALTGEKPNSLRPQHHPRKLVMVASVFTVLGSWELSLSITHAFVTSGTGLDSYVVLKSPGGLWSLSRAIP